MENLNRKITIVEVENWVGIYLDGKCVYQDHSADAQDMCKVLGLEYKSHWLESDMWDSNEGFLPDDLSELTLV